MFKKLIVLSFLMFCLSACVNNQNSIKTPAPNTPETSPTPVFNCLENQDKYAEYSEFFQEKDFLTWCEECVAENGKPQINRKSGPFCNPGTSDAGKICQDSLECESFCLADDVNATSGKCYSYRQLGNGCGWIEMMEGKTTELCAD
jgi:hypothetical protein